MTLRRLSANNFYKEEKETLIGFFDKIDQTKNLEIIEKDKSKIFDFDLFFMDLREYIKCDYTKLIIIDNLDYINPHASAPNREWPYQAYITMKLVELASEFGIVILLLHHKKRN